MSRSPSPAELLKRARAGEAGALEELLLVAQPPVVRYLRSRFSDLEPAQLIEDVLSETLMRVLKSYRTCKASSDNEVLNWILTIARHEALRELCRRPLRFVSTSNEDPAEIAQQPRAPGWRPLVPGTYQPLGETTPTPELRECLMALRGIDWPLDDPRWTLLYLREVEGLTWSEVGEALGISASAAKRRYQRAVEAMKRHIQSQVSALPNNVRRRLLAFLGED